MLLGPTHWGRSFKNSKHIRRALRLARYAKRNYNVPLSRGASTTEIDDVNQSREIHCGGTGKTKQCTDYKGGVVGYPSC